MKGVEADAQVTWHFYIGMLAFLNGEDKKVAETSRRIDKSETN